MAKEQLDIHELIDQALTEETVTQYDRRIRKHHASQLVDLVKHRTITPRVVLPPLMPPVTLRVVAPPMMLEQEDFAVFRQKMNVARGRPNAVLCAAPNRRGPRVTTATIARESVAPTPIADESGDTTTPMTRRAFTTEDSVALALMQRCGCDECGIEIIPTDDGRNIVRHDDGVASLDCELDGVVDLLHPPTVQKIEDFVKFCHEAGR